MAGLFEYLCNRVSWHTLGRKRRRGCANQFMGWRQFERASTISARRQRRSRPRLRFQVPAMNKSDLKEDLLNANKGTTRGKKMLERSLEKLGAGRSILTDRAGNIIAGNKTFAAARDREVIVVPSDGSKLVVVQRTDLEIDSPKARELAIADNRIAEVDLEWNDEALKQYTEVDLNLFWNDGELARIVGVNPLDAPPP